MRFDWFQKVDAEVRRACADRCVHFYEITVGPHHVQYRVSRDGFTSDAYRKAQAVRLEECVRKLNEAFRAKDRETPDLRVIEVAANPGDEFLAPYLTVRVKETGVWP